MTLLWVFFGITGYLGMGVTVSGLAHAYRPQDFGANNEYLSAAIFWPFYGCFVGMEAMGTWLGRSAMAIERAARSVERVALQIRGDQDEQDYLPPTPTTQSAVVPYRRINR